MNRELLEKEGWTVESGKPMTLRSPKGERVTGEAAQKIHDLLLAISKQDTKAAKIKAASFAAGVRQGMRGGC